MSDPLDVTFFVACLNEERHVAGALDKLAEIGRRLGFSYEILVFDDCSTDRTGEVVLAWRRAHPEVRLLLFRNRVNRGLAHNFVEAAFHGRGRFYRLICGDDTEPVESHLEVMKRMGQADIVLPDYSNAIGKRGLRLILSEAYTMVVNAISGNAIRYYNGCALYRRRDVLRWHVEALGFGFQAELTTRLIHEGRSHVEVKLVAEHRGESRALTLRNFLSVAYSLFKIGMRRLSRLVRPAVAAELQEPVEIKDEPPPKP
ncbi:MAG: glycosyltransferase [Alphaproteobacteria bacterium]|nr:glycosyltransferase [Alphaproteobacteria bacterium]